MSNGGSVGAGGQFGQTTPTGLDGAAYTPVKQGPMYQSQYQQYQPQTGSAQSQFQQQMPNYQSGLQAAMMQMMQQYSRPMMREPMQQGLMPYNNSALNYRPDMSNVTANLNRVAPSVELEQKRAAEEAARLQAEQDAQAAANPPQDYSGGGG
jgi:hypothetical protein